jgi:LPS sulfotransferase NodH
MENEKRDASHKKNAALEGLFPELKKLLEAPENAAISELKEPQHPILFIMGCARSGTTLLFQYLAATGYFSYPSNILSRFYFAPYIGARIQQLLVDFDQKGEIFSPDPIMFQSTLGKAKGPKQPHEFWYFWNRFFKFKDIQQLDQDALAEVDTDVFLKELAGIQKVFGLPLVMKAMNLNWNIPFLYNLHPQIFFIHIKRDLLYNAQSLLLARKKFFGNFTDWYSFKPPNYHQLVELPFWAQVIEQVLETNKAIEDSFKLLTGDRCISIRYEDFCERPSDVLSIINEKFQLPDYKIPAVSASFKHNNRNEIDGAIWTKMVEYIENKNAK